MCPFQRAKTIKSKARFLNLKKGQQLRNWSAQLGAIRCLEIHPYFDVLVAGGDAKFLSIWDHKTGKLIDRIHRNPLNVDKMVVTSKLLIIGKLFSSQSFENPVF